VIAVPQNHSDIQLVVFDLGRVLVRICDDLAQACALVGVDVPRERLTPDVLLKLRDVAHRAEVGGLNADQLAREVATLLGVSPQQFYRASEAFILGPYPGAADLISELTAAGLATACLTNTSDHHWQLLSQEGHPAYFPLHRLNHRFASHLVRFRKPDAAIYEHVERETRVLPERIAFFDDVAENVDAARGRGWKAYQINVAANDPVSQIRAALLKHALLGPRQ